MISVVVNNTSLTLNFDVERQGCAAIKKDCHERTNKKINVCKNRSYASGTEGVLKGSNLLLPGAEARLSYYYFS